MLPVETVTFLFTDIEGSTHLWEKQPEEMKTALARHDTWLRETVEKYHGHVIKSTGDGIHAVFSAAIEAVESAVAAQKEFQQPMGKLKLNVRMGVHTGEAEQREGDYFGSALNRAARLMAVAHGGQVLVSNATMELVREQLPTEFQLRDLGEHRLKDLIRPEHIYQVSKSGMPSEFPALETLDAIPNNLPVQLTSFIGREKEIAEVKRLLDSGRLVTLTGSGGTGKTRLSLETGAEVLRNFPNGAWLIELAPLAEPGQIHPALAQAFGIHELPDIPLADLLMDYLRDKKLLLILDNCEHLIGACARLADDLLHHCTGLKILASSREALGIAGELAYHTPSLGESESSRLFAERARATNPSFALKESTTAAINQICLRLDGIPLAIELAAARTRLFSPEQIAARLNDLFRLLVGGSRTALPRQQTLRALIDWSYELLAPEEQRLLRSTSVFVGGWNLEALEVISDDPNALELLDNLINKSLVFTLERGNELRYSMLETIRQYAREKLFDAKETLNVRDRHFSYFDELAEKIWQAFRTLGLYSLRDRIDDEMENMRAAFEWGLEHDPEAGIRLAANFCLVTSLAGHQAEGLVALEKSIKLFQAKPTVNEGDLLHHRELLAKALFIKGFITIEIGVAEQAVQDFKEAIDLSRLTGDKRMLGYSLELYFITSNFVPGPDTSDMAKEGFEIFEELDDSWGRDLSLVNMAHIATLRGDFAESQKYFDLARQNMKESPISVMVGLTYMNMGYAEREMGRIDLAKEHFESGYQVFKQLRHKVFETVLLSELGHIAREEGDFARAEEIYQHTLRNFADFGNRPAVAHQLECFAQLAIERTDPQRAARLFGAAQALREKTNSQMTNKEQVVYERAVGRLQTLLVDSEYNHLWEEGHKMEMDRAVQYALG